MRLTIGAMALSALVGAAALGGATAWAGADFHVEYRFKARADGSEPLAGLTKVDGKLYGVAYSGGQAGAGAIFVLDPITGAKSAAYEFKAGQDGSGPQGTLIKIGTRLYGTTAVGGASGCGTVFSFDPTKGVEKILHAFACSPDGSVPTAGLTYVSGNLYGTTVVGGANSAGSIFSVNAATGAESVLFSFLGNFSDSLQPYGQLIYADGKLYGTTENGGRGQSPCDNGCGTVFSFDLTTGSEARVHLFQNTDGADPLAGMIAVDGKLYGTTASSDANANCPFGCGVVFSLDPATGAVEVVYKFKGGADGVEPVSELASVGNRLYGTTLMGGVDDYGVVFSVDLATNSERIEHTFRGGGRGLAPASTLIRFDGRLYGTTTDCYYGECKTNGILFSIEK